MSSLELVLLALLEGAVLLGPDIDDRDREWVATPGYEPLNHSASQILLNNYHYCGNFLFVKVFLYLPLIF